MNTHTLETHTLQPVFVWVRRNFFEKRVGEYQKAGVMASLEGATGGAVRGSFSLEADF